jgi:AcrR family transcriptional regulator
MSSMAAQEQPAARTRDRQTRRTRRALLAAADEIFGEDRVPTVAEVAERADVARATAYRYFPTQEALLLETSALGDSEPLRSLPALVDEIPDPAERLAEAVRRGAEWTLGREGRLRAVLRMSLDPDQSIDRPARRRGYLAQLLADVRERLDADAYERLAGSLTLLLGIDPIVSLRDNGDVPPERIPDVLAWTAHALVSAALADVPRS